MVQIIRAQPNFETQYTCLTYQPDSWNVIILDCKSCTLYSQAFIVQPKIGPQDFEDQTFPPNY